MSDENFNFSEAMKKIEEINTWFESEDPDLEEALNKLKEGKKLIKACKSRLEGIENEFNELKIDFSEVEPSEPEFTSEATTTANSSVTDDSSMPF
jgi:exodeoxyribonuclease VII small subunit